MSKLGFIFLLWGLLARVSFGAKVLERCGYNQWQCMDGSCIFLIGRCDNFPDCPDGSDELGCVSVVCNEGQRPCTSGECVDANRFCDGVIHCKDAGDELAADCRGVILTTSPKSSGNISTASTEPKTTKVPILSRDPSRPKQTSLPPPTTTATPKHAVIRLDLRQSLTTKTIEKSTTLSATPPTTSLPPPTTLATPKHAVIRLDLRQSLTTKTIEKSTTLSATPPPIIVPLAIDSKSESPKWPTWFHPTTKKFRHWTPVMTTRETTTTRSTTPLWYDWYNTTFQPTTSRTPCVEVEDRFEFCRRKYRGYYLHPNDCKQYIVCEWGLMYICTCPSSTHWDMRVRTCVWDYTSPCILGQYDKPILPDQATKTDTSSTTPSKSSSEAATNAFETTNKSKLATTTALLPPPIPQRHLPVTPAWLKELTEKRFLRPHGPQPPLYQSLLTRFFKAMPQDGINQNIGLNQ